MYEIGEEEIQAVARVIRAKQLWRYAEQADGSPSETCQLERAWADLIGVEHGLAVSTGTAALICGLIGVGVEPGSEVIVPGYTFISTALAPLAIGAVPVLAEVDASLLLDPADVAKRITPDTKAIVPVHMLGHPCDLDAFVRLSQETGVPLVEDACQADGGSYRGRRLGSYGAAGAFSFNFFKILTAGEAGLLVTNDQRCYHRARIYHDTGCAWWTPGEAMSVPYFAGVNYRMDEIRAAILRVQLGRLDGLLGRLRQNWTRLRAILCDALPSGVELAPCHDPEGDCGISLLLRFSERAAAQAFEARFAAAADLPDPRPKPLLPFDSGRHVYCNWEALMERRGAYHPKYDPLRTTAAGLRQPYAPDQLPATLEHLRRTVSLPIAPEWTEGQTEAVARAIQASSE